MAKNTDKYEMIDISELHPYENNARTHSESQLEAICNSIKEFGFINPVIIDENNMILVGHGRIEASKRLGIKQAPFRRVTNLTEDQKKAYILADNRLSDLGGWDEELLAQELESINLDMSAFGFDDFQIDIDEPEPDIAEDDFAGAPDEDAEPTTKRGEIFKLGQHILMCGDSTSKDDVAKLMNGAKVDMVLSDAPYGMNLDTDFSNIKGSLKSIGNKNHTRGNKYEKVIGDNDDFKPELISTFFENFDYCKEMFLFGADYFAELLPHKNDGSWLVWDKRKESQADAIGSEFELIWSRTKHKRRMLRHDWFGFLSSENQYDARHRVHPTQKPISLLIDILDQWGKDAKTIVDLYGGSGSTLIACEKTNRKCYMMELDEHYCDVIIQRWESLTGKKAELIK